MKLLIDIGNTFAKVATLQNEELSEVVALDNEALALKIEATRPDQIVYASVRDSKTTSELLNAAHQLDIECTQVIVSKQAHDIINAYDDFSTLGIDRWLAIIATRDILPNQPFIVADLGTAMTIDGVLASGQHIGGWIIPGLALQADSIVQRAPKVFKDDSFKSNGKYGFGQSTPSNVEMGSIAALVGTINEACRLFEQQYLQKPKLIVTGGDGKQISSLLNVEHEYISNLVFLGLAKFSSTK